jgi:hypothetical protein
MLQLVSYIRFYIHWLARQIWVKNSEQFLQLHISVNVRGSDILVSFDVVTLFTNIQAEEV